MTLTNAIHIIKAINLLIDSLYGEGIGIYAIGNRI